MSRNSSPTHVTNAPIRQLLLSESRAVPTHVCLQVQHAFRRHPAGSLPRLIDIRQEIEDKPEKLHLWRHNPCIARVSFRTHIANRTYELGNHPLSGDNTEPFQGLPARPDSITMHLHCQDPEGRTHRWFLDTDCALASRPPPGQKPNLANCYPIVTPDCSLTIDGLTAIIRACICKPDGTSTEFFEQATRLLAQATLSTPTPSP